MNYPTLLAIGVGLWMLMKLVLRMEQEKKKDGMVKMAKWLVKWWVF